MAAPLAILFDKRQRALAGAKFRAWWEGEEFDEAAALAALDAPAEEAAPPAPAKAAPAPASGPVDADLFDAPPPQAPPRQAALERLWGLGRIMPFDPEQEKITLLMMGVGSSVRVAMLGPGGPGPVRAIMEVCAGPITVYEWRDETRGDIEAAFKGEARVTISGADLDTFAPAPDSLDVLISYDDLTFAANAPRLAVQIAKALKKGAPALIQTYCATPAPELAGAFASAFAEPHLRPAGDLASLFQDAGLAVESNENVTEAHAALGRAGFKTLEKALMEGTGLDGAVLREIAWETEAWRTRLGFLGQGRLERRKIVARKPA